MKPDEIQKINQLYKQLDDLQAENHKLRSTTADTQWKQFAQDVDELKTMVSDMADLLQQPKTTIRKTTRKK